MARYIYSLARWTLLLGLVLSAVAGARIPTAAALRAARLTAPIGARSQYFNLNYAVLALIIEAASGQSYADYVTEQIFTPLGMTHSYTTVEAARANGLAQGYSRFFGFAVPRTETHRAYELSDGYLNRSLYLGGTSLLGCGKAGAWPGPT
jgi:CubicO group peptidase (beta-lactamase class C family)